MVLMPYYHELDDETGDLIETVPFCCNSCHKSWCIANEIEFPGLGFGTEGADYAEYCAQCGVVCSQPPAGSVDAWPCTCGWDNVVVNRFTVTEPEVCEHGQLIQVPISMVG